MLEAMRAYIFDLNGTLVPIPPDEASNASMEECARLLAVDAVAFREWWVGSFQERNLGIWGSTSTLFFRELLLRHGLQRPPNMLEEAAQARRAFTRRTAQLSDDARRCLARLRQAGHPVGIITACGPSLPEVWQDLELASFVDHVQFSVLVGMMKPDSRCYQAMATELGVLTSSCTFIGDGAGDELVGARAVGCHPIKVRGEMPARFEWTNSKWNGDTVCDLDEIHAL